MASEIPEKTTNTKPRKSYAKVRYLFLLTLCLLGALLDVLSISVHFQVPASSRMIQGEPATVYLATAFLTLFVEFIAWLVTHRFSFLVQATAIIGAWLLKTILTPSF